MNLIIRSAVKKDSEQIIPLIYSSGPAAFDYVFNTPIAFLKKSYNKGRSQFGYQNHHVATLDEHVIASIACFDREQARVLQLGCILDMLKFYKWQFIANAIRGLRFETLIPKPKKLSLYIAHVGVVQTMQRQGVGRQLIDWAIKHATQQGYQSVSLDVAQNNCVAEHLYKSLGFIETKYNRSKINNICDHKTLTFTIR